MPKASRATQRVHLHWVRETPSRGLHAPASKTLDSLQSLPPCAQKAVRATGQPVVELHIPPYRPSFVVDPVEWLDNLRFHHDSAHRLIAFSPDDQEPGFTMAAHHAHILALRAASGDTTPLTLVAEPRPSPFLRQPPPVHLPCISGLAHAPAERTRNYALAYRAVSLAFQQTLRDFLPPAHLQHIDQFEQRAQTLSLLVWSAANPVVGRYVDQLGIDVLSERMLDNAYSGAARRLAPRLEEVLEILRRHDAPSVLRKAYSDTYSYRITRSIRRKPRFVNSLFVNEAGLINTFVQFCSHIPGWRARYHVSPSLVYREIRGQWKRMDIHFRYLWQRQAYPELGTLLLMEAVRALEAID